jgi:hypothetical protein
MTQEQHRRRMLAVARRWQISTEPQGTFAQRQGLSRSALQYWVRQLGAAPAAAASTFTPVQLTDSPVIAEASLEIVLASGDRVLVPAHASAAQLRVVLSVLRASC